MLLILFSLPTTGHSLKLRDDTESLTALNIWIHNLPENVGDTLDHFYKLFNEFVEVLLALEEIKDETENQNNFYSYTLMNKYKDYVKTQDPKKREEFTLLLGLLQRYSLKEIEKLFQSSQWADTYINKVLKILTQLSKKDDYEFMLNYSNNNNIVLQNGELSKEFTQRFHVKNKDGDEFFKKFDQYYDALKAICESYKMTNAIYDAKQDLENKKHDISSQINQ